MRTLPMLSVCLFMVMIGFGVVIPVVTFFTERLALAGGVSTSSIPLHVGLLAAVYALMQFFMAPLWGRLSDRVGRKQLILVGIAGSAAAQILFGISTSLYGCCTWRECLAGRSLRRRSRPPPPRWLT